MSIVSNINGKSLSYQTQKFSTTPPDTDTNVYMTFALDFFNTTC